MKLRCCKTNLDLSCCAASTLLLPLRCTPGGLSVRQQQVVGNLQRIRAVVKHHVAQADETRTGQFLAASAKGEGDRVKLLLQQGYNPNTCDYDKKTALMLAAAHGHKVRGHCCRASQLGSGAVARICYASQHQSIVLICICLSFLAYMWLFKMRYNHWPCTAGCGGHAAGCERQRQRARQQRPHRPAGGCQGGPR
jgi:hypothetical protein